MRTERGLDRLVTFPDAIVAIAITLLVLPLVDLLAEGPRDDLAGLRRDHLADSGSFALSSVVIARLWLVHHRIGEWTGGYDTAFPWVNLFRAFTIVLLPFSSGVVAEYGTERLSVALYVGMITASSVPALRSAPRGHGRVWESTWAAAARALRCRRAAGPAVHPLGVTWATPGGRPSGTRVPSG